MCQGLYVPFVGFHVDLRAIIKSRRCECIIYNFSTSYWQKVSDFAKYICILFLQVFY